MKRRPQAALFGGFGLTLIFLVGFVFLSYRSTAELMQQATAAEHAQEVLTQLELLMSLMSSAETGLRGFTLTGDEAFLEPYHRAVQSTGEGDAIRRLRELIIDPGQQHRLESLVPQLAERLEFAQQVVELRRNQGFEAARERIATGEGRRVQDRIRAAVDEMATTERAIQSQRQEQAQQALRYTQIFIGGGGLLTLAIAGFSLFFSARELAARNRAEEERGRLFDELHLLMESTGEGIYGIDMKGRFTFINRSAASMLGFKLEELLGRNAHELIHHSRKDGSVYPAQDCPIFRAFRTGRSCIEDGEVLWRKDGTSFPAEYSSHAILREGLPQGAVVVFNDMTGRQRAEAQLRVRNEELTGFAYTISHDLKAPLRGISGYAHELQRRHQTGLSERAQFCILQIIAAATNLDCLIEDLLKYSRVDAERPTATDVLLPDLVRAMLRDRSHTLTELGVEMDIAVPPLKLHVWERGLQQVLSNLIDNAIKYSRQSRPPRVGITAEALPAGCRLTVTDNGIGFDMAYHDRIFGLFNRLVRGNEFEGTGAGLAIVKKLVQKLGGTIRAESAPGKGATFFVELPISPFTEASP